MQAKPANSIITILKTSVELYLKCFSRLITYGLIVSTILMLVSFVTDTIIPPESLVSDNTQMDMMIQALPGLAIVVIIFTLIECVFYCAMIYRIDNLVNQGDDSFTGALCLAIKKFPAIAVAGILYTLAVAVGSILFLVPGIILSISLSFCGYLIVLEDMSGYASLIASHRLVWGDWWRINVVFAIPALVISVPFFLLSLFSLAHRPISFFSFDVISILSNLLLAAVLPYLFVLGYILYKDLKLRKNLLTNSNLPKP